MIDGSVNIEIYEIDGKYQSDGYTVLTIKPHTERDSAEDSEFCRDDENFCVLIVEGKKYTVCYDELLRGVTAAQLIAKG